MSRRTKASTTRTPRTASTPASTGHTPPTSSSTSSTANTGQAYRLDDVSVTVTGRTLIKESTLILTHGSRYGLIGPNGIGKSSLLSAIATRTLPVPPEVSIHLLTQEVTADTRTLLQTLLDSVPVLKDYTTRERTALATEDDEALSALYDQYPDMDVAQYTHRATAILKGLQFTNISATTQELSGGWRMRLSLACALFVQPWLLLLDEPTNHLDLQACVWLEEFLSTWPTCLIVVSHERTFLDNVCTHIYAFDHCRLRLYRGNYSQYLQQRAVEAATANKKTKTAKKNTKITPNTDTTEAVRERRQRILNFAFEATPDIGRSLLVSCSDVCVQYGHTTILEGLDMGIHQGDRMAILGPNGAGKSTFLKLVAATLQPTHGRVTRDSHLTVSVFDQHHTTVYDSRPHETALSLLRDKVGSVELTRKHLSKFGLGDVHSVPVAQLSGGQKTRLVLADIILQRPQLLLLDEPSNHLDIETIDFMCSALDDFSGSVVLVTHSAYLVQRLAQTLYVVADKRLKRFDGDFDDYRQYIMAGVGGATTAS